MKRKILVVDDEKDYESLINQALGVKKYFREYKFIYSLTGNSAISMLKDYDDIDIAMLDINMPDMDGLSLLKYIKSNYPNIQVIMVSAYNDNANILLAMNAGAIDFVAKPIDIKNLENTLKKTINHSENIKLNIPYDQESPL
ncbi:MAG: response regulator [Saprospiraceae bacterium]